MYTIINAFSASFCLQNTHNTMLYYLGRIMEKEYQQSIELCETLWNEYEPVLRKICQKKLSSCPSEVDDVISDTFLALCNAINKGMHIENHEAWLKGTLNNRIKKKYTELDRKKRRFIHIDSIEQELYYIVDYDEKKLSDSAIEELKNEIYNQLESSEKALLFLMYTKRLKQVEIAEKMNTSEAAVRQRLYRLKNKIRHLVMDKMENVS